MIDPLVVETVIEAALREDIGFFDLTSELVIPAAAVADFTLESRQDLVVAGIDVAAAVFRRRVPDCRIELAVGDGARLGPGGRLGRVRGPARGLLTAERTALNLLQHLSGIATLTARYVALIAHTKAALVDTRKTTPGLRALEKYAVRCGGGMNHRFGLDDAILIKDNHVAAAGGVAEALTRARALAGHLTPIEVEVDSLAQLDQALPFAPHVILLDNFSLQDLRTAVARTGGKVRLEASGGVSLDTVRAIAETGVDAISVGALTHSAPVLDIGLDAE